MMRTAFVVAAALVVGAPIHADKPALSPGEIVDAAPAADWIAIAPDDLLVMDIASDAKGQARRVVIQLMPPPFSQGWIGNIRKLAAAHWWDGTSINRVQDNYVAQWGDPDAEDAKKAKRLPADLATVPESEYSVEHFVGHDGGIGDYLAQELEARDVDAYGAAGITWYGWSVGSLRGAAWPIHCYGMVGAGRNLPPDTGSGAELYAVIGHAPRHLDRNIALVGRVIEGVEYLSSLPRGTGPLGFYDTIEERVPILSVRLGNEIPGLPAYEYLSTESRSFVRYADARANRRDAFFIHAAGGADICNIPTPVRRRK